MFSKFEKLLNDNQAMRKRLQAITEKGQERAQDIAVDQTRAEASSLAAWQSDFSPLWPVRDVQKKGRKMSGASLSAFSGLEMQHGADVIEIWRSSSWLLAADQTCLVVQSKWSV